MLCIFLREGEYAPYVTGMATPLVWIQQLITYGHKCYTQTYIHKLSIV